MFKLYFTFVLDGKNGSHIPKLNILDETLFKVKPYPVSFSRQLTIKHELNHMLDWGVIKRADSHSKNPLPNGSI